MRTACAVWWSRLYRLKRGVERFATCVGEVVLFGLVRRRRLARRTGQEDRVAAFVSELDREALGRGRSMSSASVMGVTMAAAREPQIGGKVFVCPICAPAT